MPRSFRLGRFAAARAAASAAASSSGSTPTSSELLYSASPDAAVARSLYRSLLKVSGRLDSSEPARALISLPEIRPSPSPSPSSSASRPRGLLPLPRLLPREVAAAALSRHFLKGARFYDPRRSVGCSLEGAVRASFRESEREEEGGGGSDGSRRRRRRRQGGNGGSDRSGPPPPAGLLLDAGFSALRFLSGIAAVAERHGLLNPFVLPAAAAASAPPAAAEDKLSSSSALPPLLTQRLSRPSSGTLLLPHPALRGDFARTPVLLLEVSSAGPEDRRRGGKQARRRRRRRGGGEDAGAPPPPPPVRAAAGALGAGAVGLALGAPFGPLPSLFLLSPEERLREREEAARDGKRAAARDPRLLSVGDLARSSSPLPRLARLVSNLSSRGSVRMSGGSGPSSSARFPGSAGLALARRRQRQRRSECGGEGEAGEVVGAGEEASPSPSPSSLFSSSSSSRRSKSRSLFPSPRTLSLSFSPVGERISDDGTVGPAGIAVTVGVVRRRARAGSETEGSDDSDFDDSDFADSDFDDDDDESALESDDDSDAESSSSSSSKGKGKGAGEGAAEDSYSPTLRAALALGVDVSAFDCDGASSSSSSSSASPTSTAESRLLWGGPVPGLTALHSCAEAGGDAVVLKAPQREREGEEPLLSSSSSAPPPPTLFVDGDMRKLLAAVSSSASASSSSSTVRPLARVFVGTSLWVPGQLEGEIASGAWAVASPPPQSLLSLLAVPRFDENDEEEGDGRVLWERSLRECGLGCWAKVPEEAVEEAARVGF